MIEDFVSIVVKFPKEVPYIHLYPLLDLHIGAKECDMKLALQWRQTVLDDPYGYVLIGGDLMNNGIKSSKTNVYEEVLKPQEQKDALYEFLIPLATAGRILSWNSGNHEYRSVKEVGTDPGYDVACRLGIEGIYRQNACFLKISLGEAKIDRQQVYTIFTSHGSSRNKHQKFLYCLEGVDLALSGHTHIYEHSCITKMHFNPFNNKVRFRTMHVLVLSSFLKFGGYALRAEYLPQVMDDFVKITLCGNKKKIII